MSEATVSRLQDFSVIKLSGQDAFSFLQGQVTCDVNQLKEQPWLAGCHCNAKGKMWSSFIAFMQDQDIFLVMSKDSAEASLAELNKYGVFAKTDIINDSDNWHIYGSSFSVDGEVNIELAEQHLLILSRSELPENDQASSWWQREILSGRAHLFSASIGEYVPQMLNLQALDYISFNKGCYMGQEMVARMRYLGKNKRALYIAQLDQELSLTPEQEVAIELNGNKRNIGKVIHWQINEGKTWLQLVLPKNTELSETLYLSSGQSIKLLELPYQIAE